MVKPEGPGAHQMTQHYCAQHLSRHVDLLCDVTVTLG